MSAPEVQDRVHAEREAGSLRDRLTTPSRSRSVAIGAVAFAVGYPLLGFALPDGAPFGVVLQGAVFGLSLIHI